MGLDANYLRMKSGPLGGRCVAVVGGVSTTLGGGRVARASP